MSGVRRIQTRVVVVLMLALPALNGCLWHTRRVPRARLPTHVLTATPEQLVQIVNQNYDSINSLSAAVTFTATSGGSLNGKVKTITPFSGYILLRKPEALRVIGYLPVVHSQAFDMASNGNTFKLWIPPKSEGFEGTNTLTQPSTNALENMRPYMFFDSLLIRKITDNDRLMMTADTDTEVNPKTRKLEIRPEYLLTVARPQDHSNVEQPERVIQFSRIDLRPVEEDIYGPDGQVQTQAIYGPAQTFGDRQFPGTVTIRWPLQQQQILITIQKLRVNLQLNNDQFEMKIPAGIKIKQLH
jgi:outer membrane lipoprotein-sorting protein